MASNSKRARRSAAACFAVGMAALSGHAAALTLDEYFAAALQRSEIVANQIELIRQAEERYNQARSGVLPTVNAVASRFWQDPVAAGTSSTSPVANRQSLAALTLSQPVFRGFREFAGLRQTQALVDA